MLKKDFFCLKSWFIRHFTSISILGPQHLEGVLQIERACFSVPWSEASLRRELSENERALYLGARIGKKLIGYVGVWLLADEGHITNCAVAPRWQGFGVGTRLLRALQAETAARGIRALTLEVRRNNLGAQRFYSRLGFKSVGLRPKYYLDNGEDAMIMWYGQGEGEQELGAARDCLRH